MTEGTLLTVGSSPTTAALLRGLNNPIRREILRFLLSHGQSSSAKVKNGISPCVGWNINFHFDILVEAGALDRTKRMGYRESFYAPTNATRAGWVTSVLRLTESED